MALKHCYIGIENLNLNATQRDTLIDVLKALGPASDSQPAHLNHWRTRLDNEAIILEALFNEDNLTVAAFKNRLAAIFGVDPASVGDASSSTPYGPMVTFSRGGTDYLQFLLFGGAGATWQQSGDGCRAYLAANAAEWEPAE
jgi:hypothetical protein